MKDLIRNAKANCQSAKRLYIKFRGVDAELEKYWHSIYQHWMKVWREALSPVQSAQGFHTGSVESFSNIPDGYTDEGELNLSPVKY